MKTVVPKTDEDKRRWYLIDAKGEVLGRLASQIATLLKGKHKPEYTPHLDMGDHVIVINAKKIKVTGNKLIDKEYDRFSGYPGGRKVKILKEKLEEEPEFVIRQSVKGMLPKNPLGRKMIKKMKIYAGGTHPHEAQQPETLPEHLRRI